MSLGTHVPTSKQQQRYRRNPNSGPARRLRRLREEAGYETAQEAALAAGVKVPTYHHYENGLRAITMRAAQELGKFFKVAPGVILFGDRLHSNGRVPILGSVGRNGRVSALANARLRGGDVSNDSGSHHSFVSWFSDPSSSTTYAETQTMAPPGISDESARRYGALRVDSNDLIPLAFPGDVLHYRPTRPGLPIDGTRVHNRCCVILLRHDECLVGIVLANSDGSFTRMALGLTEAYPIVAPLAIWPVLWTQHYDPDEAG